MGSIPEKTTRGDGPRDAPSPGRPAGRLFTLARVAWIAVAALAVGLFVASLPEVFRQLATACGAPPCADGRLTPEGTRALRELGLSARAYAIYGVTQHVVWASVWCAVGVLVFWRKPDDRMALLSGLTLVTLGATFTNAPQALAERNPLWEPPIAFVTYVGQACFILFVYLFPDGRFVPRWTCPLALAAVAAYAPAYLLPDSPLGLDRWPLALSLLVPLTVLGTAVVAQVYRYRRVSGPRQRRQTRWVVFGLAVALGGFLALILLGASLPASPDGPLSDVAFNTAIFLLMLPIPLCVGIAIVRHRLFDVDLVINRALVYGVLTVGVIGLYVLVVGGLGVLLETGVNPAVSLAATGLVAVLFAPLRERLQRAVNRLMYGERDDPYAVISRLGRRLEGTLAPDAVLPAAVGTVKDALRLPYVAVEVERDGAFETVAVAGEPAGDPLLLPLLYGGVPVGRLVLCPRAGEGGFSPADGRLLDDLTRQIGVAVHATGLAEEAVRLSADLQRSREKLVTAREEERRRLRRDLHDGLGPQLAGLTMRAEAARDLIPSDPARADRLLAGLAEGAREAVAEVRRLVHALRPPALDSLGLVGAIRSHASHLQGGLRVGVEAPDELPALPAAVEVACYRIALEAVNNAARHAGARNCAVRLALGDGTLELEVADDGRGMAEERGAGVGLHSMRERAEELGGSFVVGEGPAGGTRVAVRLPLARGGAGTRG